MSRPATIVEAVLASVLLVGALMWWSGRGDRDEGKLATLHTHTVVTKVLAAQADSTFIKQKIAAAVARGALQPVESQLRANLHDTVRVLEYIDRVARVLVKDSAALAAADSDITAHKVVIAALDSELTEARKPAPIPRFRYTVGALYDPLNGQPSGSGEIAFRVIGGVQLVARAEQRPVLERPAIRVGVAYSF